MNGYNNAKKAQKVIIYWDYENCPIPNNKATSFANVWNVIKRRIFNHLQYKVPVETRVYIAANKLRHKVKQSMDICGAKNIDIPSWKPEAVDKRMLVDLALDLYEWKGHNICNAVVLISGDKDFGNILGRIHNAPEIAKLILVRLPTDDGEELPVNHNLYSSVDYIIDNNHGTGFDVSEFIDCWHGSDCKLVSDGNCKFFHHDMHHNNYNYVQQNSPLIGHLSAPNSYQSPPSSISNISVSSQESKDEQKDVDINQKTLEIRSKISCKHGDECWNWKKGNCHYNHPKPYIASSKTKSPPPTPLQQQAQHNDGLLDNDDNKNKNNNDNNSNEWACTRCTFLNVNKSTKCSMCDLQRKVDEKC